MIKRGEANFSPLIFKYDDSDEISNQDEDADFDDSNSGETSYCDEVLRLRFSH